MEAIIGLGESGCNVAVQYFNKTKRKHRLVLLNTAKDDLNKITEPSAIKLVVGKGEGSGRNPKKTQENDKYKMKCANDNSYSVIRILQEDVFYDTYDWLSQLNDNIIDIIKNKKVQNIYMCKDNEYDIFN